MHSDVLVILDCCHAALKTRGEKEVKMEVLAASGSVLLGSAGNSGIKINIV